ncbi:MAG TPA: ATP-binding protein [Polyangiaceae bacterium]
MSAAAQVRSALGHDDGPHRDDTPVEVAVKRVRAFARRRLAWFEHLRGGASYEGGRIGAGDLRLVLDDRDSVEAERSFVDGHDSLRAVNAEIEACDRLLDGADGDVSALAQLAATFELSDTEQDILQVCLASALDPTLGRVWATLHHHPDQNYPSEALIARLCGHGRAPILPRSGPLLRWELVRVGDASPGDPQPLQIDPHIVDFLCGRPSLDPVLSDCAATAQPLDPPACWPVADLAQRVRRVLAQGRGARIAMLGPRNSGRKTLAACVTHALGGTALAIDTSAANDAIWTTVHLHAQRQALLSGSSLVWYGDQLERRSPLGPGLVRLQFAIGDVDLGVAAQSGIVDERFTMPQLSIDQRRELWRRLVPASQAWPAAELDRVAERYRMQVGDIAAIGQRGVDGVEEAQDQCRKLTRHRLGDLGRLIECPFSRDDLMVSASLNELLDHFLFEARERVRFWERSAAKRLFPRGTGLVALMTGPPGTGKTMAAQVVASELKLDLVRIDLASAVNKYIGETAKNLRRVFARAAEMNAVLLFDEADALFSKRTDVRDSHDRYANADTNYLLQLVEEFEGIALLASNKMQNLDVAFVRRIRYVMDFPRPRPSERLAIFRRLVRELTTSEDAERLDPALVTLADTVDMSGAQIKLSVLAAVFIARQTAQPMTIDDLLAGVDRELAKEGRSVNPRERERIVEHVR